MAAARSAAAVSIACVLALAAATRVDAAEPVRLAATLATPGEAAALVDFSGEQVWLRAGESAGGCRLARVEAATAQLECDGRHVRLVLEPGGDRPVEQAVTPGFESAELAPGALHSLAARPQAIALAVDFAPVVAQGRMLGWRVARLAADGPLADLGLREADVIHAVDGAPAAEPAAFAAAIRSLPDARAFTLELSRDGLPLTVLVAAPPAQ